MNRLLLVMLVVIMLCCSENCIAESDMSDQMLENVWSLYETYEKNPDGFSTSYLMEIYLMYNMYLDTKSYQIVYQGDYANINAMYAKEIVKVNEGYKEYPSELFNKWLAGEISEEECMKEIMEYIEIIISSAMMVKGK